MPNPLSTPAALSRVAVGFSSDWQTALDQAKQALEQASSRPRPILDVSARDAVMAELDAAREAGPRQQADQLLGRREAVDAGPHRARSRVEHDRVEVEDVFCVRG